MSSIILLLAKELGKLDEVDSELSGNDLRNVIFPNIAKVVKISTKRMFEVWGGSVFTDKEIGKIRTALGKREDALASLDCIISDNHSKTTESLATAIEKVDAFLARHPDSRLASPRAKAGLTVDVFQTVQLREELGDATFSLALDILDDKL